MAFAGPAAAVDAFAGRPPDDETRSVADAKHRFVSDAKHRFVSKEV